MNMLITTLVFFLSGKVPACKQETSISAVRDLEWATGNCTLTFNAAGMSFTSMKLQSYHTSLNWMTSWNFELFRSLARGSWWHWCEQCLPLQQQEDPGQCWRLRESQSLPVSMLSTKGRGKKETQYSVISHFNIALFKMTTHCYSSLLYLVVNISVAG